MHLKKVLLMNIVIFSIILVFHILRSLLEWPAMIGGVSISLWISYAAVVVSLLLIYINYKAFRQAE